MRWTELFADVEARLAAEVAAERRAEVADRTRREWAGVTLADRLATGIEGAVVMDLVGAVRLEGRVEDLGKDWLLLVLGNGSSAVVPLRAVLAVAGLPSGSDARPGLSRRRFGLGVALRELARDRVDVRVLAGGGQYDGVIARVGADHVDLGAGLRGRMDQPRGRGAVTLAFDAITAVFETR